MPQVKLLEAGELCVWNSTYKKSAQNYLKKMVEVLCSDHSCSDGRWQKT